MTHLFRQIPLTNRLNFYPKALFQHHARVLEAMGLLSLNMLMIRCLDGKILGQRLQQRQRQNHPSTPNNWNEAQRNKALDTARAIKRACRWLPFNTTCLAQSMAAQSMLNRRGVSCIIHFGVRKSEADLNFHAWVLCDDLMVTGGDVSDYQVFRAC